MARKLCQFFTAGATAALLIAPAVSQDPGQRRSSGGRAPGGERPLAPTVLKNLPADSAHPFVGAWQGSFRPGNSGLAPDPRVLTIEFLNGEYTGYTSFGNPPRGAAPHQRNVLSGKTLSWEMPNSGGGFLIYTAELIDANTMKGVLTSRDVPVPPGEPGPIGTFSFKRRPVNH